MGGWADTSDSHIHKYTHTHAQPPEGVAGPLFEELTRARLDRASLARAVYTFALWAEKEKEMGRVEAEREKEKERAEKEKERAEKEKERAEKEKERASKAEAEKELLAERVERKEMNTELLRLRGCLSLRGAWGEWDRRCFSRS
jgi:hypothetical protein